MYYYCTVILGKNPNSQGGKHEEHTLVCASTPGKNRGEKILHFSLTLFRNCMFKHIRNSIIVIHSL